jgi:hypothetical protein
MNKVVKVTYEKSDYFPVPKNIDLNNKEQVMCWYVKWNELYILLTNKKEIMIESVGFLGEELDYKDPDNVEVKDVAPGMFDPEDFKEVSLADV